jgi:hypothetical protein
LIAWLAQPEHRGGREAAPSFPPAAQGRLFPCHASPNPLEILRRVDTVRSARGGLVFKVVARLSDGRVVSFWEAKAGGQVVACEGRAEAFEALRHA